MPGWFLVIAVFATVAWIAKSVSDDIVTDENGVHWKLEKTGRSGTDAWLASDYLLRYGSPMTILHAADRASAITAIDIVATVRKPVA